MRGQLAIGSVLAGYRVLELIGEGASGAVYLVEREGTGERLALKVLAPDLARDERFRRRFLRESTIAADLDHPHVVPIVDFGEADDAVYLVMSYVEGSDLRERLARSGPLPPEEALRLVGEVGAALDEAHAHGLVHRDVKPANILLDGEGRAHLGDFGLAKHASSASSLTGESTFVGTIAYVSPEQIRGEEIDGRADVYSLACVLYELLAGRPPFDRDSELAVVFAHLNEPIPRITDLRPELPGGLDRVLRAGTAKDPKDRYATCAELVAAARGALAGERGPREPVRRRTLVTVAAGLAAVAAAVVAVVVLTGGTGDDGAPPVHRLAVGGDGMALVDPRTRTVAARVRLPERPSDVVFDDRSAWALLPGAQQIAQVDLRSRGVRRTVKLPFHPGGIAAGRGAVYATELGGPGVVRVSARTGKIAAKWDVPARGVRTSDPTGMAVGSGSVWLARGAEVVRVDGRTGRVQHRFPLPITATLLAFSGGHLWAASSEDGLVEKIDPAVNRIVARASLHGWISALTVAGGSVWASAVPDDVVFRLDEDDASLEGTFPAPAGPESLSADSGAIYVAGSRGRAIARLDIGTGRRTDIALTGSPELVRAHGGALWTAATPQTSAPPAASGPEIRVAIPFDGLPLDPAGGTDPTGAQFLYATCLKLLNYPDAAGAAGRALRPEAAAAMPVVSGGGRTYTFRIRRGLRFSPPSGAAVDAQAFRHTIERALSPDLGHDSVGLAAASDIAGATAFNAGRARHVSGIVARGDTLSITLEEPAGDLPARLALPVFCAVPAGTPSPAKTRPPVAMAGPYYVRSQTAGSVVIDRNPNYRGPRPRRPARIEYLTGVPSPKAVALADGDDADVVPWDFDLHGPVAPGGALARRATGGRYNAVPGPGVDLIAFNTRRPLFAGARLRRAVSYALDRPALVRVYQESPTDRYVPPAVSGAKRPIYPLAGPDLATARRLAGDGPPRSARLYFCGDPVNVQIARIVRANLRPLGIRVTIVQSFGCLSGPDPKAQAADLLLVTRATQILDPAPFLEATVGRAAAFGHNPLPITWSDRAYRERLAAARRLAPAERSAAYARIEEDMLRREAPYAAFGSFVSGEYLSARSGCRLVQGAYGVVDLAAMCVRKS